MGETNRHDCEYRSLYEGTQASLTDMAGKQAEALGRIGRLRNAVVHAMKAARPTKFAEVESKSRMRVQDGDDRFIVAVLEHLLSEQPATSDAPPYAELTAELARHGVHVHGTDLRGWIQQLRSARGPERTERATAQSFADASKKRQEQVSSAWIDAAVQTSPTQPGVSARPVQDTGATTSTPFVGGLEDIFIIPASDARRMQDERTRQDTPDASDEAHHDQQTGVIEGESGGVDTEPVEVTQTAAAGEGGADIYASDPDDIFSVVDDPFSTDGPVDDFGTGPGGSFDDPFGEDEDDGGIERDENSSSENDESVGSGENDEDQGSNGAPGDRGPIEPTGATPEVLVGKNSDGQDLPGESHGEPGGQQVVQSPTETETEKSKRRSVPQAPVRMELFPHTAPKRPSGTKRRRTGSKALPPEAFQLDGGEAEGSLSDDVRRKLHAAVCAGGPTFCSDLVSVAGSVEAIEAWQEEEEQSRGYVRFVHPKNRYRQLGSLAIPKGDLLKSATEFQKSWWHLAAEKYRGGKTYEIGVVGRRVAGRVRGWHVDPTYPVVSFRVMEERGLCGVVIVCDDDISDGSLARTGVVSEIESMLREPLEMMFVLATGDRALDALVQAIDEEAKRREWKAQAPLVCGRSWEWVDASGPLIAVI